MNNKDTRWIQRFQNLKRAFEQLSEGSDRYHKESLDKLLQEGIIQRFEYTFELTWKTMKDYLEAERELVKSPRSVIKKAFEYELIEDGTLWMDILDSRNLLSHTYDEKLFKEAFTKIVQDYYPALKRVFEKLERLENENK